MPEYAGTVVMLPLDKALLGVTSRYELVRLLGQGGMGEVHLARDKTVDRLVAIKVLHAGADHRRFAREARIAASVSSPHTVPIFDYLLLADGRPIIIMEYIDGRSLEAIIDDSGDEIPISDLERFMLQAAEGLHATSEAGVVHRDVKPANFLVDKFGQLRVADYGIARYRVDAAATRTAKLTYTDLIVGTPRYMSPEQITNSRYLDSRSDVYSFGATFYHVATGRPPFVGDSNIDVMMKHLHDIPVSPSTLRPMLPSRFNDVIERCLAKSASDRFQSFDEVSAALLNARVSPWEETFDPVSRQALAQYREDRTRLLAGTLEGDVEYGFPNGRSIRIRRGNIASMEADCLVSSDDEHLTRSGGVAAALDEASGRVLGAETAKFHLVRQGGVVVTGAGQLKARFVFHAVTLDFERAAAPSRDVLLQILAGCFYHADTLRLTSMALPLLGTGTGGFPVEVCLDTMMSYLVPVMLFGGHSMSRVDIVMPATRGT